MSRHRRPERRSHWPLTAVLAGTAIATAALVVLAVVQTSTALAGSSSVQSSPPPTAPASSSSGLRDASTASTIPVYAYLYQWFTASSWNRAKEDYPLAGRYSSDDINVLRTQVKQAQSAGIDGFITSWKSTVPLNRRMDMLVEVAKADHFDLGVVYQALDFSRNPLPIATVKHDMVYLVDRWGAALTSRFYGRPVIIWTGTDKYSLADVQAVKAALGDRAYLLAASKSVDGYERVAATVDGEAYYWSSADPSSPATRAKLVAMSEAVHAHKGLWFAPAASGYDGRTLGGTRVVGRDDGRTLTKSLDNAYASAPDAVAVISWNEWSENTYIEPGEKYGDRELVVLRQYLATRTGTVPSDYAPVDSSQGDGSSGWTGSKAAVTLAGLSVATVVLLLFFARRPPPRLRGGATTSARSRQGWGPPEGAGPDRSGPRRAGRGRRLLGRRRVRATVGDPSQEARGDHVASAVGAWFPLDLDGEAWTREEIRDQRLRWFARAGRGCHQHQLGPAGVVQRQPRRFVPLRLEVLDEGGPLRLRREDEREARRLRAGEPRVQERRPSGLFTADQAQDGLALKEEPPVRPGRQLAVAGGSDVHSPTVSHSRATGAPPPRHAANRPAARPGAWTSTALSSSRALGRRERRRVRVGPAPRRPHGSRPAVMSARDDATGQPARANLV